MLRIPFVCRRVVLRLEKYTPEYYRESHMYLTGKTGSGKSSYLEMLINAIRYKSRKKEDAAIVVIDPHGDMVERIAQFKLVNRKPERVVYVDPFLKK